MSSKFSNTTITQKPPHICNKPPPGPPYEPPPIIIVPINGYAQYINPATPSEGGLITTITLHPVDPPNAWRGAAAGGAFRIELTMTASLNHTTVSFRLDWFVHDNLDDTVFVIGHRPRSWAPFDSGEVRPAWQPHNGRVGFRIWF